MTEPLQDVTGTLGVASKFASGRMNAEGLQKAQEQGWVQPSAYQYSTNQAGSHAPGDDANQDDANKPATASIFTAPWASDAGRYEWDPEGADGDVGPRNPALEQDLFHSEFINRAGDKLSNLTTVEVVIESEERVKPIVDFKTAGLHPILVENIKLCGYENPTPIQAYTIPAIVTGHDIIGVAQTGSGKTAAFLIPCISKLMGKVKKLAARRPNIAAGFDAERERVRAEPLILIVAPTRELCCQIFDEARRLCYRSMLRPCVVYGGGPIRDQIGQLQRGCDLLVATPGRLKDFMDRPEVLSLSRVRYTIVDEADELLHDDWEEDMAKIMSGGDANIDGDHRYLLFSATFPKRLQTLAANFLAKDHIHVSIGRTGSVHVNVKQNFVWTEPDAKQQALYDLLIAMPPSRTLVFVRSKKAADFVDDFLFNLGLPTTSIHSDRMQIEREDALRSFKSGQTPILITTGVSARGLDVKNVMHVINFDLPLIEHDGKSEYVHRIGRTARIGNEGLATSFYNDRDVAMAPFLTKILMETGQEIPSFFESFKPTDGKLNFDEEEENAIFEADGGGGGWGNDNAVNSNGGGGASGAGDNTPAANKDANSGGEAAGGWGESVPVAASAW
ncbi:hypothetical protein B0A52_05242 [Exophiala mesophila]|uniref:RNA helicase n=1 Tax=Exophiala mesophila TaxID=212818 RepID=A0A438N4B3_EXOME|nr:hypothetical protein B0A52_05242 [Exophiala mesophila]